MKTIRYSLLIALVIAATVAGWGTVGAAGTSTTVSPKSPLFIEKTISGYKFSEKHQVSWAGPFDEYIATYVSGKRQERKAGEKKQGTVLIGLAHSNTEANTAYTFDARLKNSGKIYKENGSTVIYIRKPEKAGYLAFWTSNNTAVTIEGVGAYTRDEQAFLQQYLKKYPSTLPASILGTGTKP